jgi:hypothetical protein
MSPITSHQNLDADQQLNLALLRIAYPAFRFSYFIRRSQLRWVAVRKDATGSGLHTIVTPDLDELQAALAPSAELSQFDARGDCHETEAPPWRAGRAP